MVRVVSRRGVEDRLGGVCRADRGALPGNARRDAELLHHAHHVEHAPVFVSEAVVAEADDVDDLDADAPAAARPQWLAQGIPRAARSPAASGGRSVEPVTEEDS
jgi:hypothetical protein